MTVVSTAISFYMPPRLRGWGWGGWINQMFRAKQSNGGGGGEEVLYIPQWCCESEEVDKYINVLCMTKSTDKALGQLAGPFMMHSDKWINQHTIRACDFIYGTYEHSSGGFWQMSFLANWFCCCPEAQTVMAPLPRLQMDDKHEPNGCPRNFCMIGKE